MSRTARPRPAAPVAAGRGSAGRPLLIAAAFARGGAPAAAVDPAGTPAADRMTVVGRVLDPEGKPVPNATVMAYAARDSRDAPATPRRSSRPRTSGATVMFSGESARMGQSPSGSSRAGRRGCGRGRFRQSSFRVGWREPFSREGRSPNGGHPCTASISPTPSANGSRRPPPIATATARPATPATTIARRSTRPAGPSVSETRAPGESEVSDTDGPGGSSPWPTASVDV